MCKLLGPLKYKIVLWLAFSNKMVTRNNGLKSSWIDPNRCVLCCSNEESVTHLFATCTYARQVWSKTSMELCLTSSWNSISLEKVYKLGYQTVRLKDMKHFLVFLFTKFGGKEFYDLSGHFYPL